MTKTLQSVRGMNDILPRDIAAWQALEHVIRQLAQQYGYHEIRTPLLESVALFKRSVGEASDIVQKEMYQFQDQNDDILALRPEGTAACVRACIQHGLTYNQKQRLWYMGPMYRRERPQKGRYRQFYQFGLEAFGQPDMAIEIEQILWIHRFFQALNMTDITLEINTLGTIAARQHYTQSLVTYLNNHFDALDADSQQRLTTNPLRILDSKVRQTQDILNEAPRLFDSLSEPCKAHFQAVQQTLDALQIPYTVSPRLVRGLDYYTGLVFEWTTDALGAQGTLCAGGRYDGLVAQLGGQDTPAFGFAMGLERILALYTSNTLPTGPSALGHVLCTDASCLTTALAYCEQLRSAQSQMSWVLDAHPFKLKNQLKRAHKAGADLVAIIGPDECANQQIQMKWMQQPDVATQWFSLSEAIQYVQQHPSAQAIKE